MSSRIPLAVSTMFDCYGARDCMLVGGTAEDDLWLTVVLSHCVQSPGSRETYFGEEFVAQVGTAGDGLRAVAFIHYLPTGPETSISCAHVRVRISDSSYSDYRLSTIDWASLVNADCRGTGHRVLMRKSGCCNCDGDEGLAACRISAYLTGVF
jgi:hypothetical protein